MNENDEIKLPERFRQNPFNVPNDYFDALPNRIMQKCEPKTEKKKRSLISLLKPALAFAAGFLILVGLPLATLHIINTAKPETKNYLSNNVNNKDISQPVFSEKEMTDDVENEIIAYLVDEQNITDYIIENEE